MDVDKDEVSEHYANRCFGLLAEQVKECGHGITYCFATGWYMHGTANIDRRVSIARQIGGAQQAGGDARCEHLAIPGAMIVACYRSRVGALEYLPDTGVHGLVSLPLAAGRERISIFTIVFVQLGIP